MAHFLLTYEREFLPVQNVWRDSLVHSEEKDSAPGVSESRAGRPFSGQFHQM